ncbi:gas vesicle protein [soil metagenome]
MAERYELGPQRSQGLVDILDRILDKGLVIAGDIKINLANVELLTIRIRLLVCSIDKAEEIGMNWWRSDPSYAGPTIGDTSQMAALNAKLDALASKLETIEQKQVTRTPSTEK